MKAEDEAIAAAVAESVELYRVELEELCRVELAIARATKALQPWPGPARES